MILRFVIPERMDNVNDYQTANRGSKRGAYIGAAMKRKNQQKCKDAIELQIKGKHIGYCDVVINWVEKDKRRDHDNIAGAIKFILDALVEEKVIVDDGPQYIGNITHTFAYDKFYPRIEVMLIEPTS